MTPFEKRLSLLERARRTAELRHIEALDELAQREERAWADTRRTIVAFTDEQVDALAASDPELRALSDADA